MKINETGNKKTEKSKLRKMLKNPLALLSLVYLCNSSLAWVDPNQKKPDNDGKRYVPKTQKPDWEVKLENEILEFYERVTGLDGEMLKLYGKMNREKPDEGSLSLKGMTLRTPDRIIGSWEAEYKPESWSFFSK